MSATVRQMVSHQLAVLKADPREGWVYTSTVSQINRGVASPTIELTWSLILAVRLAELGLTSHRIEPFIGALKTLIRDLP